MYGRKKGNVIPKNIFLYSPQMRHDFKYLQEISQKQWNMQLM
jgi:hypothetical protein